MKRWLLISLFLLTAGGLAAAQVDQLPQGQNAPGANQAPPRDDEPRPAGVSSSHDTRIDITPPKDDIKDHPKSAGEANDQDQDKNESDVQEMHPWDPHKALKDIEVGDYYFRLKNYRAALDRYREALFYKPDDAIANFRLGQSLEKLEEDDEAVTHYQAYLKILPHGPLSKEAEKAIQKLRPEKSQTSQATPSR
jgi:tetratricopeptide (TPR) repeat protein